MKKTLLLSCLFIAAFTSYAQQKQDTVWLEYTPKQVTLEDPVVIAKANTRFVNKMYTTGCFAQLNAGDTLFDLRSGMKEKDLFEFFRKNLKGFSCDMIRSGSRGQMSLDIPRYNGAQLGLFVDEKPSGKSELEQARYDTKAIGVIKFFKEFKCGPGTGPAIVIYYRKLKLNN